MLTPLDRICSVFHAVVRETIQYLTAAKVPPKLLVPKPRGLFSQEEHQLGLTQPALPQPTAAAAHLLHVGCFGGKTAVTLTKSP